LFFLVLRILKRQHAIGNPACPILKFGTAAVQRVRIKETFMDIQDLTILKVAVLNISGALMVTM
jgi:hypothetical protein